MKKNKDTSPIDETRTEEVDADSLESEAQPIEDPIVELEAKLAQAEGDKLRALADLQNFRRRAAISEREAREQGVRSVLMNVVPVLDHFELAMQYDPETASAEQILGGVKLIRDELLRAFGTQGVSTIEAGAGDAFSPDRHEAVVQVPSADVETGAVVELLQVGYAIGERVIRPAKVSVATDAPESEG